MDKLIEKLVASDYLALSLIGELLILAIAIYMVRSFVNRRTSKLIKLLEKKIMEYGITVVDLTDEKINLKRKLANLKAFCPGCYKKVMKDLEQERNDENTRKL